MLNRISRNFIGLFVWLFLVALCIVVNLIVIISNYLGCRTSFELLGYEMFPIRNDQLVGWFFDAFASKAAQAHFFALSVALTLAIGLIMIFHNAFSILNLYQDKRAYIAIGDKESAEAAKNLILREVIIISAWLVPLALAIVFDIMLFRYRSVAGAMGIEDPRIAAITLKAWKFQLSEQGNLFAWSIARWGAFGYIGLTAIACLGIEFSLMKLGESWAKFCGNLEEIFNPNPSQQGQIYYGYDAEGQPVYDPNAPLAYDVDGNPLSGNDEAVETASTDAHNGYAQTQEPVAQPTAESPTFSDEARLFDPAQTSQNDHECERNSAFDADSTPNPEEDLREVMGGIKGERVSLTNAIANPQRYWVDPETHEVWDANFRRELMEDEKAA